jgi:CCR4-NOT transcription complex subunit 7/8
MIKDVWAHNLEEELANITSLVEDYPYIAMDTEFPGVVARPVGQFKSRSEFNYQTLRCNVDLLKIIQLGITLADEEGNHPPGVASWQFNFKFSLRNDLYAQDSIELLRNAGIDFFKHELHGIEQDHFSELFIPSGIAWNDRVKWITFHSGYDFGYLIKLLTWKPLPTDEQSFLELFQECFPCVYDIKHIARSCRDLKGGLNELAYRLDVHRVGAMHQAGSDSLLSGAVFFKMRQLYFEGQILGDPKYLGVLYGFQPSYCVQVHA